MLNISKKEITTNDILNLEIEYDNRVKIVELFNYYVNERKTIENEYANTKYYKTSDLNEFVNFILRKGLLEVSTDFKKERIGRLKYMVKQLEKEVNANSEAKNEKEKYFEDYNKILVERLKEVINDNLNYNYYDELGAINDFNDTFKNEIELRPLELLDAIQYYKNEIVFSKDSFDNEEITILDVFTNLVYKKPVVNE